MATTRIISAIQVGPLDGLSAIPTRVCYEAANQSYKKGAIIKQVANLATIHAADDVNDIFGIALQDASGTTNDPVPYVPAIPSVQFEGTLENSGATGHVLAVADIANEHSFAVSGDYFYLDKADNNTPAAVVTGLRDELGDITSRVYFAFLPEATIYSSP